VSRWPSSYPNLYPFWACSSPAIPALDAVTLGWPAVRPVLDLVPGPTKPIAFLCHTNPR
jgi:hypothetical protein